MFKPFRELLIIFFLLNRISMRFRRVEETLPIILRTELIVSQNLSWNIRRLSQMRAFCILVRTEHIRPEIQKHSQFFGNIHYLSL